MDREERNLIARCQQGDRDAFDALIRAYYPYVSGFLTRVTADTNLSEDLTQDTFLKMIRNIERYDPKNAAFGTWLIAIAKHVYVDHLRRNRIVMEDIDAPDISAELRESTDFTEDALRREQYDALVRAIDTLPPEQGIAIRLKYESELTLQEIADRFGVPPKTLKSRIHDGTVKLRRMFQSDKTRMEQE